ncbi:TIGR02587 family membrane protein [Chthonobacter rhizosphaerae]|uniref:TIGR02587 family membrane protein n=1 Tax=Chthonobacter rhizosphaerae TaxID=2735553 RepID=UPI0015EF6B89|nr:TIGR02587 family membrane protein [Chthonobacter rhizosphaerae]
MPDSGSAVAALVVTPKLKEFATGLGRAFAGALIFALPMLMTMEMWQLGFIMEPLRMALLLGLTLPLLVRLSRFEGFRETAALSDDIADALVAVAVAFVTVLAVLWFLGELGPGMSLRELFGKVAVQMVPASIGAMLAQNQLGGEDGARRRPNTSYGGEIFLMVVGALFLSFSVAPTEEVVLIAYRLSATQELMLAGFTMVLMHGFVYGLEFGGTERPGPGEGFLSVFARFTIAGYAAVLLVSLYMLWTFGRTDGISWEEILSTAIVLSFPGAIGAAVARLIL